MGFKDFKGIFKKRELIFEKSIKEKGDMYSFVLKSKEKLDWKAGIHGIFTLDNVKGMFWRAFSIASTSDENEILISTRISDNPSNFKKRLLELKKGDKINMKGPFGPFYISKDTKQVVGFAGGIGITPFRALLKENVLNVNYHLVYSDNNKNYLYLDIFKKLEKLPNFTIEYITSKKEMESKIEILSKKYKNSAEYFISGAPKMVSEIRKNLKNKGIKNIKNDTFYGY
jgi:ferredoxin-NADP reductase